MLEKQCLLMKAYGWTPEFCDFEITGAEGWSYWAWARQNEATIWGSHIEPVEGYVAQEIKRRKK